MATTQKDFTSKEINPLVSIEEWEDDVLERYPDPDNIATG
jgi:inositol oxygenase